MITRRGEKRGRQPHQRRESKDAFNSINTDFTKNKF